MRTLLVLVAALVVAVPAAAGGFATVGVTPMPDGGSTTWTPTLTVKAHGVTPVDDARPFVTIENPATGESRVFGARHTGRPGEYRVTVEFPSPGTWRYSVTDGYAGQVHTFAPVEIRGTAGAPSERLPWAPVAAVGAALAAAAAAAGFLLLRRRGRSPAAATAAP